MANFMEESCVKFACSCGLLNPISKLYFCRHCLKIRCGFCLCHEVDVRFCSNCLENIPSSEARSNKSKCKSCFDCPCCQHTLSIRATSIQVTRKGEDTPKEGDESDPNKVLTKKLYYLACLACRWTSRDVGIPDQTSAKGAWPENEYSYQARFQTLLEYYQNVVLQDKQEKQEYLRRKTLRTHKFPSLTDRTGLTVSMIRRQIGWPDKNVQKTSKLSVFPSQALEEVDELPTKFFTEKLNLRNVTTIEQRHGQPAHQPFTVNKLYPQRKNLCIKRSLRCRQCEHNVIKPEYHPGSIKYRIQLFAAYHVPDVLLVSCEKPLKPGSQAQAVLKISNPTMHDMTITIMDLPTHEEEYEMMQDLKISVEKNFTSLITTSSTVLSNVSSPSFSRQTSISEDARLVDKKTTAEMKMLESSFILNHRDDTTEYDELAEITTKEEPSFIISRKSNKVSLKVNFTPNRDLAEGDEVVIGFTMQYTYINTVTNTAEKKEPQQHALNSRVYISMGTIAK